MASPRSRKKRPSEQGWLADSIRVTAFCDDPPTDAASVWWAQFVGRPPEREEIKPLEGLKRIEGPLPGLDPKLGRLNLLTQVGRVDWVVGSVGSMPGAMPMLGSYNDIAQELINLLGAWLRSSPAPIRRLAWGATLNKPATTREEGYGLMAKMLPFDLPADSSDLVFRINRPIASSVDHDLTLNRLMTWAVLQVDTVALGLDNTVGRIVPGSSVFICRLELDISTPPGRNEPLPKDEVEKLLTEMFDTSMSIAESGYPK
jgi:hypothetical protein